MGLASPRMSDLASSTGRRTLPLRQPAIDDGWWVEPLRWVALAVFIGHTDLRLFLSRLCRRSGVDNPGGGLTDLHCAGRLPSLAAHLSAGLLCAASSSSQTSRHRKARTMAGDELLLCRLWRLFRLPLAALIATNGDGHAIAAFFVVLSLAALLSGMLYTGKTWCNYLCPVSFVEKIYTEPHGLRETSNSQCAKCTACKKSCPDINEENGYWKDIDSRPKRFVYYAFPGLVFGFYFYFYAPIRNLALLLQRRLDPTGWSRPDRLLSWLRWGDGRILLCPHGASGSRGGGHAGVVWAGQCVRLLAA